MLYKTCFKIKKQRYSYVLNLLSGEYFSNFPYFRMSVVLFSLKTGINLTGKDLKEVTQNR